MLAIGRWARASCSATTAPSDPTRYHAAAATDGAAGCPASEREPQAGPAKAARRAATTSGALRMERPESNGAGLPARGCPDLRRQALGLGGGSAAPVLLGAAEGVDDGARRG